MEKNDHPQADTSESRRRRGMSTDSTSHTTIQPSKGDTLPLSTTTTTTCPIAITAMTSSTPAATTPPTARKVVVTATTATTTTGVIHPALAFVESSQHPPPFPQGEEKHSDQTTNGTRMSMDCDGIAITSEKDGNDRVTVDPPPKQPLVIPSSAMKQQQQRPIVQGDASCESPETIVVGGMMNAPMNKMISHTAPTATTKGTATVTMTSSPSVSHVTQTAASAATGMAGSQGTATRITETTTGHVPTRMVATDPGAFLIRESNPSATATTTSAPTTAASGTTSCSSPNTTTTTSTATAVIPTDPVIQSSSGDNRTVNSAISVRNANHNKNNNNTTTSGTTAPPPSTGTIPSTALNDKNTMTIPSITQSQPAAAPPPPQNTIPHPPPQGGGGGGGALSTTTGSTTVATTTTTTPLADAFGPYVRTVDQTLDDARKRLRTALEQTYRLRKAFTERVYGKYRVCLRPPQTPASVLARIAQDPVGMQKRLLDEIATLQEEKDSERKIAAKLNSDVASIRQQATDETVPELSPGIADAASLWTKGIVDHAEQIMLSSAGLSLIILPEEEATPEELQGYHDRAPIDRETGQRVKNISQAAATAGSIMLERKRKALLLRLDQQNFPRPSLGDLSIVQTSAPPPTATTVNTMPATGSSIQLPVKALQLPATIPATSVGNATPKDAIRTTSIATSMVVSKTTPVLMQSIGKANRPRPPSGLSSALLLSLNPSAEELGRQGNDNGPWSPSTLALLARGIRSGLNSNKLAQQRLRHPYPDSLGGRRRAGGSLSSVRKDSPIVGLQQGASLAQSDVTLPTFLALTLPPLPTPTGNVERKPLPVVPGKKACTDRASQAINKVLTIFDELGEKQSDSNSEVNKISFFHRLQKESLLQKKVEHTTLHREEAAEACSRANREALYEDHAKSPIDPLLALTVLAAVGLIERSPSPETLEDTIKLPTIHEENRVLWSKDLISLRMSISTEEKFTASFMDTQSRKRGLSSEAYEELNRSPKRVKVEEQGSERLTVESIRGGGEVKADSVGKKVSEENVEGSNVSKSKPKQKSSRDGTDANDNSTRNGKKAQQQSMPPASTHEARAASGQTSSATIVNSHPAHSMAMPPRVALGIPDYSTHPDRYGRGAPLNVMHLSSQLQQIHHHPAGDLAEYLGGANARASYDLSSFLPAGQGPPMLALSGMSSLAANGIVGYSLQERAAAARALLAREQHTAAMLGSASPHSFQATSYGHVGTHPAVSALLGPHGSSIFQHGQLGLGVVGMQSSLPLPNQTQTSQRHHHHHGKSKERSASAGSILESGVKPAPRVERENVGKDHDGKTANVARKSEVPKNEDKVKKPEPITIELKLAAQPLDLRGDCNKQVDSNLKPSVAISSVAGKSSAVVGSPPGGVSAASCNLSSENAETGNPSGESEVDGNLPNVSMACGNPSDVIEYHGIPSKPNSNNLNNNEANNSVGIPGKSSAVSGAPPNTSDAVVSHEETSAVSGNLGAESNVPGSSGLGSSDKERNVLPEEEQPHSAVDVQVVDLAEKEDGLILVEPCVPASLSLKDVRMIQRGFFHDVVDACTDRAKSSSCLRYLREVAAGIPISNQSVLTRLNEAMDSVLQENPEGAAIQHLPRAQIASPIIVWLWAYHKASFLKANETEEHEGDEDPEHKQLIQMAAYTVVNEIFNNTAIVSGAEISSSDTHLEEREADIILTALVSKSLMGKLMINGYSDLALHQFEAMLAFLDEARLGALRAKSQERVLLANLLARFTTIPEAFSQAYVSSMVRAGEALGHGTLFEIVQNEDVSASTMIPYDIFTDDTGAWEDPCKTSHGYISGLTGDELTKRAHARAMIQKSLRKLQERHSIRGGTPNYGPYPEASDKDSGKGPNAHSDGIGASSSISRAGLKRRYSSFSEPPVQAGTGSARIPGWAVFEPKHASEPLDWQSHHLENTPYGRHRRGDRARALTLSFSARGTDPRAAKKGKFLPTFTNVAPEHSQNDEGNVPQSTVEINWVELAGIFQNVELTRKSSSSRATKAEHSHGTMPDAGETIFAPFCRRIESDPPSDTSSESDEDTSDEVVTADHQKVLDEMKAKLTAFLEARKQQQDRRKNRTSKL